jgi:hypothetical protein
MMMSTVTAMMVMMMNTATARQKITTQPRSLECAGPCPRRRR